MWRGVAWCGVVELAVVMVVVAVVAAVVVVAWLGTCACGGGGMAWHVCVRVCPRACVRACVCFFFGQRCDSENVCVFQQRVAQCHAKLCLPHCLQDQSPSLKGCTFTHLATLLHVEDMKDRTTQTHHLATLSMCVFTNTA